MKRQNAIRKLLNVIFHKIILVHSINNYLYGTNISDSPSIITFLFTKQLVLNEISFLLNCTEVTSILAVTKSLINIGL